MSFLHGFASAYGKIQAKRGADRTGGLVAMPTAFGATFAYVPKTQVTKYNRYQDRMNARARTNMRNLKALPRKIATKPLEIGSKIAWDKLKVPIIIGALLIFILFLRGSD